jgi:hypothetical protein
LQHRLAYAIGGIADTMLASGDASAAVAKYKEAEDIYERLVTADSELPEWRVRRCQIRLALTRAELLTNPKHLVNGLRLVQEYFALDRMATRENLEERAGLTTQIFSLATRSEEQAFRLENALSDIRRLDALGKLEATDKELVTLIEAARNYSPCAAL